MSEQDEVKIHTTMIGKETILVFRGTMEQILPYVEKNYVYPIQAYSNRRHRAYVEVAAGMGNRLTLKKLDSYKGAVPSLLVAVLSPDTKPHNIQAYLEIAAERYKTDIMDNPHETAKAVRENVRQLLGVYRICHGFLNKLKTNFAAAVLVDKELASYIGQFISTSLYLLETIRLIFEKPLAGNNLFLEALKKLPEPDDRQARRCMKRLVEVIELAGQMEVIEKTEQIENQTSYTPERMSNLGFAAVFLDCGSWPDNNTVNQAARGADLYEEMRSIAPELPEEVTHYIRYPDIVTAQTPNLFEISFLDKEGEVRGQAYRAHALADAQENIRAEIGAEARHLATVTEVQPRFSVLPAPKNFATDLICLVQADRFVDETERKIPAAQIVGDMAMEITQPYPDHDPEKALTAEPTLYSKILAALAGAHKLAVPRGAIVLLLNVIPEYRQAVRHRGLAGSYALCLGRVLFIFADMKEPDKLLPGPFENAITTIWQAGTGRLCRGFVIMRDPVTENMYAHNSTIMRFPPAAVVRDFIARHKEAITPYL